MRKILFEESDVKISLSLSSECDTSLYLFKQNIANSELGNYLNDLQLAYENYIAISREKLLDIQKLIPFIPKTECKFYDSLYSLDLPKVCKTQELLHQNFDNQNKDRVNDKSSKSKRIKKK